MHFLCFNRNPGTWGGGKRLSCSELQRKRLRDQNWQINKGKELSGNFGNACQQTLKTCPGSFGALSTCLKPEPFSTEQTNLWGTQNQEKKNPLSIGVCCGTKKKETARVDGTWADTMSFRPIYRVKKKNCISTKETDTLTTNSTTHKSLKITSDGHTHHWPTT